MRGAVYTALVSSLLAAGGALDWAPYPPFIASLVLLLAAGVREVSRGQPSIKWIRLGGAAAVLVLILTAVPLPAPVVSALSPGRETITRELALIGGSDQTTLTLALEPSRTRRSIIVLLTSLALFLGVRNMLSAAGLRPLTRGLALIGMFLVVEAFTQLAVGVSRPLGVIEPLNVYQRPFGLFFNRNDFAIWVGLVLPVVVAYALTSVRAHRAELRGRVAGVRQTMMVLGGRAFLPLASAALLFAALNVAGSRAAFVGVAAAAIVGWLLSRGPKTRRTATIVLAIAAVVVVSTAIAYGGMRLIAGGQLAADVLPTDRLTIWTESLGISRDFWLMGTGVGGFRRAMLVYQRTDPRIFFNHAHSQYLQWLVEGGVVLVGVILVAGAGLIRAIATALRDDRSHVVLIRIGAIAALAGFAVMSIWQVSFAMPANTFMFAVIAAIACHQRPLVDEGPVPRSAHAAAPRQTR